MGQEIVYCYKCRTRLTTSDFDKGRAFRHENHVACATCAPELIPSAAPPRAQVTPTRRMKIVHAAPRRPRFAAIAVGGAAAGVLAVAGFIYLQSAPPPPLPPLPPVERPAAKTVRPPDAPDPTRTFVQELGEIDGQARPLVGAQKFREAAAIYEAARGRHPQPDWNALLEGKIADVDREARRLFPAVRDAAVEARKAGKADEVRRARERIERWGVAPLLAEFDSAVAAIRELGPWRALFDGKTLDFLNKDSRSGWMVENGALIRTEIDNSAQSKDHFGDGEFRIRFEIREATNLYFNARQGRAGGMFRIDFTRADRQALDGGVRELVVRCLGSTATATIDGKPHPVFVDGVPLATGRLAFNGKGKVVRFHSFEWREFK